MVSFSLITDYVSTRSIRYAKRRSGPIWCIHVGLHTEVCLLLVILLQVCALETQELWLILFCKIPIKKKKHTRCVNNYVLSSIFMIVANFTLESIRMESSTYNCTHLMIGRTFWRLAFTSIHFRLCFSSITYIYFSCCVLLDMFMSQFCSRPCTFILWCQMSWHSREQGIPESHSYTRRPSNNLTKHESDCKPQKYMPLNPNFVYSQRNFSLARYRKCLLSHITIQQKTTDAEKVGEERHSSLN